MPEAYFNAVNEYKKEYELYSEQIKILSMQCEGLCTRIQLASDKILQKMINEIDDIGDISLMDLTIKSLSVGTYEQKILDK